MVSNNHKGTDEPSRMSRDDDFAAYMTARWPGLVRSLIVLGCEPEEAEDVVQTGLIRTYRSWDRVTKAEDLDAYVYRTVLNCWAKSRRRRWWGERPTEVLPMEPAPDPTRDALNRLVIEQALGRLSEAQRTVLVLRFVADLTEAQVAQALGLPIGTVKSRVSRAIARIDLDDLREETS